MLQEELGIQPSNPSAWWAALTTFLAFVVVGFLPLLPFVLNLLFGPTIANPFVVSTFITAVAFFLVGAIKSRFVDESWYWSGLETLAIGGAAAALAYVVGILLKGLA
jgi:VIT1/CCC1 family predicted Fe2+/Mn2+ transporter